MPVVCLNREGKPAVVARIMAVRPDSPRQFGSLNAHAMLLHLRRVVEISLGEAVLPDQSNIFSRHMFKWLVFYVLPWPKGKIKAPAEFTPVPDNDFETERKLLLEAVDRFIERAECEPSRRTLHPMFGPMTLSFWARAHGKHLNHHLEQFGV